MRNPWLWEVMMDGPQNPAGAFAPEEDHGPERRDELIAVIETAPAAAREAVAGLTEDQLDTRYRNCPPGKSSITWPTAT
jgi:hypothetical protein